MLEWTWLFNFLTSYVSRFPFCFASWSIGLLACKLFQFVPLFRWPRFNTFRLPKSKTIDCNMNEGVDIIWSLVGNVIWGWKGNDQKREKKVKMKIVAKALDGQRYPLPLSECMWVWGSWWEGANDLCWIYLSLKAGIRAWRLGFEPGGWDLSFEAGIWASWLGFGLRCWDLSFEVGIQALRLGFGPRD